MSELKSEEFPVSMDMAGRVVVPAYIREELKISKKAAKLRMVITVEKIY